MAEQPRLRPSASFDAEIARISEQLDADVVFRLVEREAGPMHECQLHDETPPPRPERYEFTITENGESEKLVTCKDHGIWVHAADPKGQAPDHSDSVQMAKLSPRLVDPNVEISRGVRIREAPDRGAGGGPGGRSMAPDPPPPPRKVDRTYDSYGHGR